MLDIVIFGGVGDLSLRKLLPSLYYLCMDGNVKKDSRITCVSRGEFTDDEFLNLIREKLEFYLGDDFDIENWKNFSEMLCYQRIDLINSEDWQGLKEYLAIDHKATIRDIIYYLSVMPALFGPICEQLKKNDLNPEYSRLVVEKPLGEDFESARKINDILSNSFAEKQIYRIDHYLGKEAVQNIMHLRFSNHLMESVWNSDHIEHVEINVFETVGVESRAQFLDRIGTLRDMVQNHLMQILSYITMEAPKSLDADDIRDQKIKIIDALEPINAGNVKSRTIRAQYDAGEINGVKVPRYLDELEPFKDKVSGTGETFVALKVNIDNDRWRGVPFYLRTGKRLESRFAEIRLKFKPPSNNLYDKRDSNQLIIEIQPDLTVSLHMTMKQLMGAEAQLNAHQNQMDLNNDHEAFSRIPEAYERLIQQVIKANQTYFVRYDEIMASWKWIDTIRGGWQETDQEMQYYSAGSTGPVLD